MGGAGVMVDGGEEGECFRFALCFSSVCFGDCEEYLLM